MNRPAPASVKAARLQLRNSTNELSDSAASCSLHAKETDVAASYRAGEQDGSEKENTGETNLFTSDNLSKTTNLSEEVASNQTSEERNSLCALEVAVEAKNTALEDTAISSSENTSTMSPAKENLVPATLEDESSISRLDSNGKHSQSPVDVLPILPILDADNERSSQLKLK